MAAESLSVHVLRRASELLGGARALSRKLHVPHNVLENWLQGVGAPPREIFMRAVDIIGEHETAAARGRGRVNGADREGSPGS